MMWYKVWAAPGCSCSQRISIDAYAADAYGAIQKQNYLSGDEIEYLIVTARQG
jgi:hypothetical protein